MFCEPESASGKRQKWKKTKVEKDKSGKRQKGKKTKVKKTKREKDKKIMDDIYYKP